jgi:hypothetical protein
MYRLSGRSNTIYRYGLFDIRYQVGYRIPVSNRPDIEPNMVLVLFRYKIHSVTLAGFTTNFQ